VVVSGGLGGGGLGGSGLGGGLGGGGLGGGLGGGGLGGGLGGGDGYVAVMSCTKLAPLLTALFGMTYSVVGEKAARKCITTRECIG